MPVPLIPDDSAWPDTFLAPDNGDFVDAASVQGTAQPLLNGEAWLKSQLETTQAWIYGIGSTKYYYFDALPMVAAGALGGGAPDYDIAANISGGSDPSLYVTLATGTNYTPFSLARLGNFRGKIRDVYVKLKGAAGHGALPENMPLAKLTRTNPGAGSSSSLVDITDASTDVSAYESWHWASGLVGDNLHEGAPGGDPRGYTLWLRSEFGANAVAGLSVGFIVVGVEGE